MKHAIKRKNERRSESRKRTDIKCVKESCPSGSRRPEGSGFFGLRKRRIKKTGVYHTRLPPKELIKNMAAGVVISAGAAFLFYRSVWALTAGGILIPLYVKRKRDKWIRERKQRLQRQFISGMQIVSGLLTAGYSVENAWKKAQQDLDRLYGADAEFCRKMKRMNQRLEMNEQLDRILYDFALESGVEDIYNFAEIFCYVKRSGGNLTEIIRTTVDRMQEKAAIMEEIENVVTSKKMEQKMMNLLLPGILLFVTVSSPAYVSALYHNVPGVLVMSICLAGYTGCFIWSERLTDIAV